MRAARAVAGGLLALTVIVVPTGPAFAGEVTGPPGRSGGPTAALAHANSACAASGLNDLDPDEGQNASQVQTPADAWRYYGLPKGSPGTLGLCRGGTGQR